MNDIICDIEKAIELLKETPRNMDNKIYLKSDLCKYKKSLEEEGFEVIIVDDLPNNISILYGNLNKGGR